MKYRISGSDRTTKEKGTTFGYKLFETDSEKKFIKYVSTHAICPAVFKKGHRLVDNITEILPFIRLDVDVKGMDKKVQKALRNSKLAFIKKPSVSNIEKGKNYKWHYIIPISNVSQNYDEYKLQYYKFLVDCNIDTAWVDMSLASVVQNMNAGGKQGVKITTPSKGKIWEAPKVKAPKKPKIEARKLKGKELKAQYGQAKDKLKSLNPNMMYPRWIEVGMALHTTFGDTGFKIFNKWSKGSDKYDAKYINDQWLDFDKTSNGDITLGTLFGMIKD